MTDLPRTTCFLKPQQYLHAPCIARMKPRYFNPKEKQTRPAKVSPKHDTRRLWVEPMATVGGLCLCLQMGQQMVPIGSPPVRKLKFIWGSKIKLIGSNHGFQVIGGSQLNRSDSPRKDLGLGPCHQTTHGMIDIYRWKHPGPYPKTRGMEYLPAMVTRRQCRYIYIYILYSSIPDMI